LGEFGGTGESKVLVIGENMMQRVRPYAQKIGAEVYEGMPGYVKGMEAAGKAHNKAFMLEKVREGYRIIDIGPDFLKRALRGASENYEMERELLKGYELYEKAFERLGPRNLILP
jgi:hypothetical protein